MTSSPGLQCLMVLDESSFMILDFPLTLHHSVHIILYYNPQLQRWRNQDQFRNELMYYQNWFSIFVFRDVFYSHSICFFMPMLVGWHLKEDWWVKFNSSTLFDDETIMWIIKLFISWPHTCLFVFFLWNWLSHHDIRTLLTCILRHLPNYMYSFINHSTEPWRNYFLSVF